MLSYEPTPNATDRTPGVVALETDPVELMARTMRELQATGRIVDAEALRAAGYTSAEIAAHGTAAADLATMQSRAA